MRVTIELTSLEEAEIRSRAKAGEYSKLFSAVLMRMEDGVLTLDVEMVKRVMYCCDVLLDDCPNCACEILLSKLSNAIWE